MKRVLLTLLWVGTVASAQDYAVDDAPVIMFQGSGKGQDERDIQFSGGSDSEFVKNHKAKNLGKIESAPPIVKTKGRRNVYRCKNNGRDVFADDDNKNKFSNCVKISEQIEHDSKPITLEKDEALRPNVLKKPVNPRSACTGALVYQGNTYVFSDQEPCPIPPEVFITLRN